MLSLLDRMEIANENGPSNQRTATMSEDQNPPVIAPKPKIVRCGKSCTHMSGGREPKQCTAKCVRAPGHVLNCKCRSHEMD
jgi:hypothetical protein